MLPGDASPDTIASEVLVGREPELAALLGLLADGAAKRGARSAVVTGPAGIGKSRLAQEIGRAARAQGAAVWWGAGDPSGRAAPFGVIGDVLCRLAGIGPDDELLERRRKLRERVGLYVPADVEWETATVLGEAIGTSFVDAVGQDSSQPAGGSLLLADLALRAWEELLAAELGRGPLVLLIDDAHFADLPSLRLLDAALRNLAAAPLVVIAFGRAHLQAGFAGLFVERPTLELRLGELTEAAARELMRALASDRLTPQGLAALAARAGGNPFMLEGAARGSADGPWTELPDSVLAMAAARIDAAPPETRRLVRAASVLGEVFAETDVAALLEDGVDRMTLAFAIDDAIARDLLLLRPGTRRELAFRSAVVRDAAYEMFSDTDRARAHQLAARRLAGSDRDPAVLAWHFEQGGAPAEAIDPYRMAALRALAANDFETAIARARRAIGCGATGEKLGELARILADAHVWRGETSAAEREAQRAMGLLPAGNVAWFQAATAYAIATSRLGNLDALYAAARDVEGLVASRPHAGVEPALRVAQVTAMARLAIALVYAGDVPAAEPMLGRMHALRMAGTLDALPYALGFAHRAHAVRAHVRGELFAAFLAFDAAAASFERAGALRDACVDHANAGFLKTELGQNSDAEARLAAALATAKRLALPTVTANAQLNLCLLLTRRGAALPAVAMGETALGTYEKQGSARMMAIAHVYLARALLVGEAEATAHQRAIMAARFTEDVPPYRAYALAALAATHGALGRTSEAATEAEAAMAALREVGAEEGEAFVRLTLVEALEAAGRGDEARTALFEADAALAGRAAKIGDKAHREAFLGNIPEHARTMELAETLGVGAMSRARTQMAARLVPEDRED